MSDKFFLGKISNFETLEDIRSSLNFQAFSYRFDKIIIQPVIQIRKK